MEECPCKNWEASLIAQLPANFRCFILKGPDAAFDVQGHGGDFSLVHRLRVGGGDLTPASSLNQTKVSAATAGVHISHVATATGAFMVR